MSATTETVYQIEVEYADDPESDMLDHWYDGEIPAEYAYLKPILEAPEFDRLQFTVGLKRVVIQAVS